MGYVVFCIYVYTNTTIIFLSMYNNIQAYKHIKSIDIFELLQVLNWSHILYILGNFIVWKMLEFCLEFKLLIVSLVLGWSQIVTHQRSLTIHYTHVYTCVEHIVEESPTMILIHLVFLIHEIAVCCMNASIHQWSLKRKHGWINTSLLVHEGPCPNQNANELVQKM